MYSAKESGRNNFRFFTDDMNAQAVERLILENSLRLALDKGELFLVYQPQMDIATGRITGLEALLRWQHPDLGLVPPDKFIRIAENSGLDRANRRMGAQDSLFSRPENGKNRVFLR